MASTPIISVVQEDVRSIPIDKTPSPVNERGFGQVIPAVNSGAVEIQCIINRKCPFTKAAAVHQQLVFNSQSVRNFPKETKAMLTGVDGTEGLFLTPVYSYRHTFIAASDNTQTGGKIDLDKLDPPRGTFVSALPDYERQQRFIIQRTVFDNEILKPSDYVTASRTSPTANSSGAINASTSAATSSFCRELVRWQYEIVNKGKPFEEDRDSRRVGTLMPKQIASTTCNPFGNHWRLIKQTPLYRGEDFYVEFHKRARSIDIPEKARSAANTFLSDPFKISDYLPLDTKFNQPDKSVSPGNGVSTLYRNRGVVKYAPDGSIVDDTTYNLRDQAYYIIEFGMWTPDHYFIIITQRGNPICCRIENGASILVSEFKEQLGAESNSQTNSSGLTGRQIIEGDSCRMTVRNHLGNIHVQFEGPGYNSKVWVINRVDIVTDSDGNKVSEQPKHMVVENAQMALWGGNLCSGFMFGILEYVSGGQGANGVSGPVTMNVPPMSLEEESTRRIQQKNGAGNNNLASRSNNPGADMLSLPFEAFHRYTPTATDEVIAGNINEFFFTQDAQLFSWQESVPPTSGVGKINKRNIPGTWYTTDDSYKERTDGKESKIEIQGIDYEKDTSNRAIFLRLKINLTPGGHDFEDDSNGYNDGNSGVLSIASCKTPVLTAVRLEAEPNNDSRWDVRPVDVSEHVLEYSDCWSAQDFFKIDHTGNIRFYVTPGARYANNQTDFLLSLLNKTFYIEIWVRYANLGGSSCSYSKVNQFYKLFTGMCQGGTLNVEQGTRTMECQIFDYSNVLQGQFIFNSPFYDGVRDINAVQDVIRRAGFKESSGDDPGRLINLFSQLQDQLMNFAIGPDGRIVPVQIYALPSGYAILSQPFYKFSDGTKLYDAIIQLGQRGGKCFFFDAHGVAHFESYFDFSVVGSLLGAQDPSQFAIWWYTTNPDFFQGQMIFNSARIQRAVGDVFNHVKILSSTPDNTPFWADDFDYASLDDPTSEGFIGYLKTVFQKDGIFGSLESARQVMFFYQSMRRPPLIVNFESYGLPVRALDLCMVDGQVLRIMKVDTQIIPKENKWWNNVECEWLYAPRLASEQNSPRGPQPAKP